MPSPSMEKGEIFTEMAALPVRMDTVTRALLSGLFPMLKIEQTLALCSITRIGEMCIVLYIRAERTFSITHKNFSIKKLTSRFVS